MTRPDPDQESARLAAAAAASAGGDHNAWFEQLYSAAGRGEVDLPWDRGAAHPLLLEWVARERPDGSGRRAVVVGAGLGDDADLIAAAGYETTAFDLSATAVSMARDRFSRSAVRFEQADLLALPAAWHGAFDLVVESLTVQAMPRRLRPAATVAVRSLVAPGGRLLVLSGALPDGADPDAGPPWRLTRDELDAFAAEGFAAVRIEQIEAAEGAPRWRALYTRDPA